MKLAVCIFKYFPFGGIQRDGLKIATLMAERGHQVRWYALSWQGEVPEFVDYVQVPARGLSRHALYDSYQRWVQADLADRPVDLVFGLNKMQGLDAYFAGDSCFEDKARTQRGWLYRQLPRYRFFAATETAVFSRLAATRVLTISDLQTPLFQRYYRTPDERLFPLPPGIDRTRIAPPAAEAARIGAALRAEFDVDADDLLILFVGSGFRKKGLDRVLLALAALPPELYARTRLMVLGADKFDPFERMARRLGVLDRIQFLAGRNDVPRFFCAADLLMLPAYDENTGTVILEAMVGAVPVLTTANCGYAHYVTDANAGDVLPEPFSQEALNQALVGLLTRPDLKVLAANGRALADSEDLFSLVPTAADLLERFAHEQRHGTIAFCLFKYFPFGGLQRDFIRIAARCAAAGFAVRVYTLSWEGAIPPGFEVVLVPVRGLINHVRYRHYIAWVRNHLRRAPVRCVVGFNKMPGLDVYFAADPCFEQKARTLRGALYRWLPRYRFFADAERAVFGPRSSATVLLLTERQRDDFVSIYGTATERLRLLPPGVDPDRRPPAQADTRKARRQALRDEFQVPDGDYLLLSIGSGFATKGLDRTLYALAALPEEMRVRSTLLVVGQDDPAGYARLAARLGVAARVRFLAGREDVPDLLLAADLLLHPAVSESGGVVLLEGLIAGLPVIATAACGYAGYIADAAAGVVLPEPFLQAAFNQELERALAEPSRRCDWHRAGLRYTEDHAELFAAPQQAAAVITEAAMAKPDRT